MTGQDLDDIVLVPWTTLKYRLSGLRQPTNQPPADPAASTVNSLDKLYPAQPQQLYPSQSAAQLADLPMMIRFSDIDDIWVSAASASEIDQVKKQITLVLRDRHRLENSQPDDFRIRDWTEISETIASTSRLITNLLLCIAMISLVVGGVGIMNIMLVSVTERTREIGLAHGRWSAGRRYPPAVSTRSGAALLRWRNRRRGLGKNRFQRRHRDSRLADSDIDPGDSCGRWRGDQRWNPVRLLSRLEGITPRSHRRVTPRIDRLSRGADYYPLPGFGSAVFPFERRLRRDFFDCDIRREGLG